MSNTAVRRVHRFRAHPRWGDYGHTLASGHAHLRDGILHIRRTGPVVPDVTFPRRGHIVVTRAKKDAALLAELRGVAFRPTVLTHVVEFHWAHWDLSAPHPLEYPESGEPEEYLDGDHSPAAADLIGDLFELVPIGRGRLRVSSTTDPAPPGFEPFPHPLLPGEMVTGERISKHVELLDCDDSDVVLATADTGESVFVVSDLARQILQSDWVDFQQFPCRYR